MRKKAVTILEVIVALVIVAIVIGGLVNVFISSQRWLIHARIRMQGGELGKRYLDPLQMEVRKDQWTAGVSCLTGDGSTNCNTATWDDAAGITYTPAFVINPVGAVDADHPLGHLRRVRLTLDWAGQEFDPLTP